MKKNLFEEVAIKQSKLGNYDIYYLKWDTKEEGQAIWKHYDTLKTKFNIKYNGTSKILFWFVDKENPQRTLDTIRKALDFLNQESTTEPSNGGSPEAQKLIGDIDKIIAAINAEEPSKNPSFNMSPEQEDQIKGKLESFKQMLDRKSVV